ncbi:FHA domain-containing protein [Sediminispirochaeta bajacaliforniensis]|uniref:FHA domain-containing protein n=1 Tax=Sediminispirochaeta bajacaliforniensis TaxID=148 RepID=UPI00036AD272|nr:FHA domain-containing protein [Sediminispirochaeta bajacaliforniensis]
MALFGKKYCKKGHKMDPSWDYCPVCIAPLTGWLVSLEEGQVRQVYDIHFGKNLIGQGEDCEIRILMESILRQHALLISKAEEYSLVAQGSEGKMFVNGIETSSASLIDGDLISLGSHEFKFKAI